MFGNIYAGKKVFITGHTGFKGPWLATWLTMLGAEVTGYALPPYYAESHFELLGLEKSLRHIEGDMRDYARLKASLDEARPDMVFHLAAQALVRESYRDPKTTFDTNIGGAVNLLEALRTCESVRALVFITSDKCYRNVEWEWGYRENDAVGGEDPYSASKGCAEIVFRSYRDSFFNKSPGIRISTTRAGNVIGGGDWAKDRIVPDCIRALRKGETIVIRSPHATRPWQHVLEPLGGYLLLGKKLYEGADLSNRAAFNFGPDRYSNKTVKEMVELVIDIWGAGRLEVQKDPNAPHEANLLQLNCDRAWDSLRWRPTWAYEESVRQTALWYKEYVAGADVPKLTASQIDKYMREWRVEDA